MKKIILSVLAVVAISLQAQAQTPDFKLGAKAGVNFANLSDAGFDGKTACLNLMNLLSQKSL